MDAVTQRLFALSDDAYRVFQARLLPTIDPASIIGVRTPALRKLAVSLSGSPEADAFLQSLPHRFFDENNLHAFLLERMRNFDECLSAVNAFLPFVDNWATCDQLSPSCFARRREALLPAIDQWLGSSHVYTVRFGIGMLLRHFLKGEAFEPSILEKVAAISSDEYYINMMIAWFFATALALQTEAALPYITNRRLPVWIHNKTIQKAIESRRLTPQQKDFLRTLKHI